MCVLLTLKVLQNVLYRCSRMVFFLLHELLVAWIKWRLERRYKFAPTVEKVTCRTEHITEPVTCLGQAAAVTK